METHELTLINFDRINKTECKRKKNILYQFQYKKSVMSNPSNKRPYAYSIFEVLRGGALI